MWKIQRKHIGSNITKSPADQLYNWCVNHVASLFFILILGAFWFTILYGICSFIHFFGVHGGYWNEDAVTTQMLFSYPGTNLIKFVGFILIIIYVVKMSDKTK